MMGHHGQGPTHMPPNKDTQRLEAFSDGVIAILITIMALELHAPHGSGLADLRPLLPVFLSYALSFAYLGIYWNNHHHLIGAAKRVHGGIMWANLNLLFWLSLIPFATAWMGANSGAAWPSAVYSLIMFMAAISYTVLQGVIVADHGADSELARAIGRDWKGKFSLGCYAAGFLVAFVLPWLTQAIVLLVAMIWIIPDHRVR